MDEEGVDGRWGRAQEERKKRKLCLVCQINEKHNKNKRGENDGCLINHITLSWTEHSPHLTILVPQEGHKDGSLASELDLIPSHQRHECQLLIKTSE